MITSSIVVFLVGILLAMVPLVETKGAIPLVMSSALFGEFALSPTTAFLSACIGGIIASILAVIIFLPLRKILEKIRLFRIILEHCDKVVNKWLNSKKFTKKVKKKPKKLIIKPAKDTINFAPQNTAKPPNKKKNMGKFWIVFTFCALPIPFSGVWSAGALCSLLKLNFWQGILAVTTGNTICSVVILVFCAIFSEFIDLIICIVCIFAVMLILYNFVKFLLNKIDKNKSINNENLTPEQKENELQKLP